MYVSLSLVLNDATELRKSFHCVCQKKDFAISWKIRSRAKSYTNLTKRCNLRNTEKFYILFKLDMATLNRRN